MKKKTCLNPNCCKQYTPDENDDGYCSFECWEKMNCGDVPRFGEEPSNLKELLSYKAG